MLAKALNVSEPWLMGYDVPMDDDYTPQNSNVLSDLKIAMHRDEYAELTEDDKAKIIIFAKTLIENKKNLPTQKMCK